MKSGPARIVIEVDPTLKAQLYSALALESSTLKDWFVEAARQYIAERTQPKFPAIANRPRGRSKQR